MFTPKNKNFIMPELYPEVERKAPTLKDKGYNIINGFKLRDNIDYMPQKGLQESFGTIEVDLLFAGGEPGGGKSFGLLMEALRGIDRYGYNALIIKKELVSAKSGGGSILDQAKQIYLGYQDCSFTAADNPTFTFAKWNSSIQLTHSNFEGNTEKSERESQEKAKNKQCSFIAFDELTDFSFNIWSYFFSRNRDNSGFKPKMIATFNCNGWHFTRTMIDWYIDEEGLIIPERVGKIRYFVLSGKSEHDIIWGNTKQEVVDRAEIKLTQEMIDFGLTKYDMVKSFTFIPCAMMDNKILIHSTQGGHVSNVFNLGSAEQRKLFYGYWNETEKGSTMLTRSDITFQFSNAVDTNTTMYISADIGDGNDPSVAWVWRGLTAIAREITYTDDAQAKVSWLKGLSEKYGVKRHHICFDGNGIGNYIDDYLLGSIPIISHTRPLPQYDENGNKTIIIDYVSLRDQLMDKLIALYKSGLITCTIDPNTIIPYGRNNEKKTLQEVLLQEKELFLRYEKDSNRKIYFESKNTYKKKHYCSPDDTDCYIYRMIFEINAKIKDEEEIEYNEEDYLMDW